jgi:hypothetical protein
LRGARAAPGATPFSAPANRKRCIKFFQMAVRSGIERAVTVRANPANSHLFCAIGGFRERRPMTAGRRCAGKVGMSWLYLWFNRVRSCPPRCTRDCGRSRRPASPRPPSQGRDTERPKPRAGAPRADLARFSGIPAIVRPTAMG